MRLTRAFARDLLSARLELFKCPCYVGVPHRPRELIPEIRSDASGHGSVNTSDWVGRLREQQDLITYLSQVHICQCESFHRLIGWESWSLKPLCHLKQSLHFSDRTMFAGYPSHPGPPLLSCHQWPFLIFRGIWMLNIGL